uniref:Lanthionine synthetase C-like protein n=1 Tax=Meloidogyne incognita TaxID=6306 RepID=A0A914MJB1_MELIC
MEFELHKQTSRYFANPFIDDVLAGSKLVTNEWIISSIKSLVDQLVNVRIAEDEYRDDGPYVGPSGIAYALLHASKTNVGINVEKEALVILSKQQKLLHNMSAAHECRYLTGTLGFYTIQLLAGQIDSELFSSKVRRMLGLVLQNGYQKIGDDEILNGRAGFLASLLFIKLNFR